MHAATTSSPQKHRHPREVEGLSVTDLLSLATEIRHRAWGDVVTFSPKVFLPITNLCRNFCDYCSFRRSPGHAGEWTMTPDQIETSLRQGQRAGCSEALLCLGDTPETSFPGYRHLLQSWGFSSTVDYLHWAASRALDIGLLPHTNAGILSRSDLQRLKPLNPSMGLMLESSSERLCERGGPHHRAPDKRPATRIRMLREAGALKIPFTTGILIGIGETRSERIHSLTCIADLHAQYGHIQEVIIQNFRRHPGTPMANHVEPDTEALLETIALARVLLPEEISLQSPPNLNPETTQDLLKAGINDFGGISPLTPDYINPHHPWPHISDLAALCATDGFELRPRLVVYDRWGESSGYLPPELDMPVQAQRSRLQALKRPWELTSPSPQPPITTQA